MTEKEQMNELIDKVHRWGVDRKIIGNGKLETQWLKLLSEFGEMCDTLAKGGDPIDDIGDQLVVLIMMAGIAGRVSAVKARIPLRPLGVNGGWEAVDSASELCGAYRRLFPDLRDNVIAHCLLELCVTAQGRNLTLYQCLEHSYSQIKDRKGYLNEQGVFIKE